jgi:hypothetical protein
MRLLMLLVLAVPLWAAGSDLLLYAPFDGSSDAAIAEGSARQMGSAALGFADGIRGRSVHLSDDCRFATAGNFRPEEGTVAVWLRSSWDAADPASHYVFCLYGDRALSESWRLNRWSVYLVGGQLNMVVWDSAGRSQGIATKGLRWTPNEWHHVAATWRGINSGRADAELRLYVDGAEMAVVKGVAISVGKTNDVMALGRDEDGSPDYGDADADDLFIYGRALSGQEIADAVQSIRGGAAYDQAASAEKAPVVGGWWNSAWPFRAEVDLPPKAAYTHQTQLQCPLRAGSDLAEMGLRAAVNPASVRVVDEAGKVLPSQVEDGLVQWSVPQQDPLPRKYFLYFAADRYAVTGPLMAVRQTVSASAPPALPPATDYATVAFGKPWDFEDGTFSGIDQWGNKPEYWLSKKVENGIFSMDVTGDPFFIWGDMWGQVDATNQKINIDLDRFPVLEMRIRQSVSSATWELFGRRGTSDRLYSYKFAVNGTGWQRVRIDLKRDAGWSGMLSAFRIDPTSETTAHVDIDWVRLSDILPLRHSATEALGSPAAPAARVSLQAPRQSMAGAAQEISVTVVDAAGKPLSGQPVRVEMQDAGGGELTAASGQPSLALSPRARRGITDGAGVLRVGYSADKKAANDVDLLVASAEFSTAQSATAVVTTVPGPAHHYRVEPVRVVALRAAQLPLRLTAQLVDAYDNPIPGNRTLQWSTDAGAVIEGAQAALGADGSATASWRGDEAKRWVYRVRVKDDQGLSGESADICLLPTAPRSDPVVLGPNGYFRKGPQGAGWLPLGGFYSNWVGLPVDGEEGRRLLSFVDATEEQTDHWLAFCASQGVTAMRFMLRAHTPRGMEPMDVIGRVNMPLFAKVLRYMDLARKYDIRFMLTIHEDYTKPAYYNRQALETFCIPHYAGEDLNALPPYQRRFIRDRELIPGIEMKYTDPDVMACQDQYTRELVGMLKDNPQLFSWEFENEMVDCPASWANHMADVIRSVDPVTPICASHGGGGIHTADPLWWTKRTSIDFYTYHLYPNTTTTGEGFDYGAAVDALTRYGRMAGVCMLGESAGDEFGRYPVERDAERRFLMRDIIWFSITNGNPGCFFWNCRGYEVEQFRLAKQLCAGLDWTSWRRQRPDLAVVVQHPWEDDKYYRSAAGRADYWMMGRYIQHYLSAGVDFDFAMDPAGYGAAANLGSFAPPAGESRLSAGPGWQVAFNAREGYGEGIAYVRNVAAIRHWTQQGINTYLRERKPAPLRVRLSLPGGDVTAVATDLDTGEHKTFTVPSTGTLDLGTSEHDWAVTWSHK